MTTRKIALGVMLGMLAAFAVVWVIYNLSQPSDLDCSLQRAEVLSDIRESWDLDDACRY